MEAFTPLLLLTIAVSKALLQTNKILHEHKHVRIAEMLLSLCLC